MVINTFCEKTGAVILSDVVKYLETVNATTFYIY